MGTDVCHIGAERFIMATKRSRQANEPGGRPFSHQVKVTVDEEAALQVAAHHAGVSVPRLLVEAALAPDRGRTSAETDRLIGVLFGTSRQLAAVGRNLNQLARVANATGEVPADLSNAVAAVVGQIRSIDAVTRELR